MYLNEFLGRGHLTMELTRRAMNGVVWGNCFEKGVQDGTARVTKEAVIGDWNLF